MRKNDKPNILHHTPLNTELRGEPASRGPRRCVSLHESKLILTVRGVYAFSKSVCTCLRAFSIAEKGESSSQQSGN